MIRNMIRTNGWPRTRLSIESRNVFALSWESAITGKGRLDLCVSWSTDNYFSKSFKLGTVSGVSVRTGSWMQKALET
jgi:hypothetical protein